MLTDIEIAESAELFDIRQVAEKLGLTEENLELYGKYKAKITLPKGAKRNAKLILVTAINPTSSGEGKTTLLRCLNFLEFADKGTISIEDKVIFDAASNNNLRVRA